MDNQLMDNEREVSSEFHLSDAERQACEVWTRRCYGLS